LLGSEQYFLRNGGNDASFVRALYRDVTGRRVGGATLRACLNQLRRGLGRERLAARVLADPGRVHQQVEEVFQQFLGRDADAEPTRRSASASGFRRSSTSSARPYFSATRL
jgi:hypothetical protein